MPTRPTPAFRLGEKLDDPLQMYLATLHGEREPAGVPAISVPCGVTDEGLPVGIQVIGPAFAEARILQVARALELRRDRLSCPSDGSRDHGDHAAL